MFVVGYVQSHKTDTTDDKILDMNISRRDRDDSDSSSDESPAKRRRVVKKKSVAIQQAENTSDEESEVEGEVEEEEVEEEEEEEEEEGEDDGEEEEEEDEEEEDGEEEEDDFEKPVELDHDTKFGLSDGYRVLGDTLEEQRPQLTTENGVRIVKETLFRADELFETVQKSSDTAIIAKDSATLKEIGEQAKIATKNVKFGRSKKSLKFDTFVNAWMSCFGTVRGISNHDIEHGNIPSYNWSNAGLLFNTMGKHITGCDFLLGPLEIEKKKRIVKERLVDDSKKNSKTKTANLKRAHEVINKDTKDDTSKAAERLFERFKQHGKKISLFEAVLNPTSFGKTVECMFVTSFLINHGKLILDIYENGIPYLEVKTLENVISQQRYKDNDDGKSHIIFTLDEDTWKQLVEVYQVTEPFFTNQ